MGRGQDIEPVESQKPTCVGPRTDLTMGVGPVRILNSQVKQLREKEIETVKVIWDEATQEMTWEMEDLMRKSYPHLFAGKFSFLRMKNFKVGRM